MLREALAACALAVAAELLYMAWSKREVSVAEVFQFVGSGQSCESERCEDERCSFHNLSRIVAFIDSARVSLDVCVYALSSPGLSAAVAAAHERGVVVRMILDHDLAYGSASTAFDLVQKGVQVRSKASTNLMHHKFCLIDSDRRVKELTPASRISPRTRQLSISGSMNWSKQATYGNYEDLTVTSVDRIVSGFQNIFDNLWSTFEPLTS